MTPGYSCWDGWELEGKVVTTILRGSVLVDDEVFVGSKTGGKFVPRTLSPEIVGRPCDPGTTGRTPAHATASVDA
jgi:dihydropyrimidinase